jgi:hypothetical protein
MKHLVLFLFFCSTFLWAQNALGQAGTDGDKKSDVKLPWESWAIAGWHQAGASSAESAQNFFFDFFVTRPLGSAPAVHENTFNIWGQVRVASSPQQRTIPLSQFVTGFAEQLGSVPVNELAQSAEFLVGVELRPFPAFGGIKRDKTTKAIISESDVVRTLGLVGFFGANGAFSDPVTQAKVFRVPPVTSPQWPNFVSQFPEYSDPAFRTQAPYLSLVPPDRERFYRQYGFGIRYSRYITKQLDAAPTMLTATAGQDQGITHGRYRGIVLKFDGFYPLPFDEASFLYLFGTANLAVAKPSQGTPLALELVSTPCGPNTPSADIGVRCDVKPYQDNVALHAIPSSRDTYRIGVGIDAIGLIRTIKNSRENNQAKKVGAAGGAGTASTGTGTK